MYRGMASTTSIADGTKRTTCLVFVRFEG